LCLAVIPSFLPLPYRPGHLLLVSLPREGNERKHVHSILSDVHSVGQTDRQTDVSEHSFTRSLPDVGRLEGIAEVEGQLFLFQQTYYARGGEAPFLPSCSLFSSVFFSSLLRQTSLCSLSCPERRERPRRHACIVFVCLFMRLFLHTHTANDKNATGLQKQREREGDKSRLLPCLSPSAETEVAVHLITHGKNEREYTLPPIVFISL